MKESNQILVLLSEISIIAGISYLVFKNTNFGENIIGKGRMDNTPEVGVGEPTATIEGIFKISPMDTMDKFSLDNDFIVNY